MTNTPNKNEAAPISTKRAYLLGTMSVVVMAATLALMATRNPARRTYTPPYVYDTRTLRAISHSLRNFAYEYEGDFPAHVSELITTYPDDWNQEAFLSAYDHDQSISFEINDPSPTQWYQYGSFWFYPTSDIRHVSDRSNFLLMYREPRKEHDKYVVGFLDGSVVQMSNNEFRDLISIQQRMPVSSQ